jgi:energy-converting hydrogenase Eha subunit A
MENVGFRGLIVTLWQRVVLSYKTTLLGLGVLVLGVVLENLVASPNKIVATVAGVLAAIFALVKEKLPPPPPVVVQ